MLKLLQKFRNYLSARRKTPPKEPIHDFTRCYWGHNINSTADGYAVWSTPRLMDGDVIKRDLYYYEVSKVKKTRVNDMVFCQLKIIPNI